MTPTSANTPAVPMMPTIEQKFEEMKKRATNINETDFRDLPALECARCSCCVSFGGCDNFEQQQFTVANVCRCNL